MGLSRFESWPRTGGIGGYRYLPLTGELQRHGPGLGESRASVFTTKGAEMESTPIFNGLRNEREFMCQACTDHGWPFAMFVCAGDGLCDDQPWPLFEAA